MTHTDQHSYHTITYHYQGDEPEQEETQEETLEGRTQVTPWTRALSWRIRGRNEQESKEEFNKQVQHVGKEKKERKKERKKNIQFFYGRIVSMTHYHWDKSVYLNDNASLR